MKSGEVEDGVDILEAKLVMQWPKGYLFLRRNDNEETGLLHMQQQWKE